MQKIVTILFVLAITVSCSLTRKKICAGSKEAMEFSSSLLLENVIEQNITNSSFYITKAEIEVITDNEKKQEFVASIKFSKPDKYLISLKSKAGIEAVRMFITDDTILINDRFNRIHYYGSTARIYKKYGLSNELLSLVFGDFKNLGCSDNENSNCKNDVLIVKCNEQKKKVVYEIDCSWKKVKGLKLTNEFGEEEFVILFNDFAKINNISIPKHISTSGIQYFKMMNITIQKIELPWEGEVDFIPGNKYERIEIL